MDDVDLSSGPNGRFIDDNYNDSTSGTAQATLTNSFAALVDRFNPANSPFSLYTVVDGSPGMDTDGAAIPTSGAPAGYFL